MRPQQEAIYTEIGSRIRTRRKELAMTQERLAQKLEISRASLANIETGRQSILLHNLYAIAAAVELRLEDLLSGHVNQREHSTTSTLKLSDDLNSEQKKQIERVIAGILHDK